MQNKTGPGNKWLAFTKSCYGGNTPANIRFKQCPLQTLLTNIWSSRSSILSLFVWGQGYSFRRGLILHPHSHKISFHFNITFLQQECRVREQVKKMYSLSGCVNTLPSCSLLKIHRGPGDLSRVIPKGNVFKVQSCLIQINVIFLSCYMEVSHNWDFKFLPYTSIVLDK